MRSSTAPPLPLQALVGSLALALWAGDARAATVVLSPFLVDASVTPKQQAGLHQLIASELDFSASVDGVVELKVPPPTLNDGCLANPGCLGGITQQNGGNAMLAGKITANGTGLVLDMAYFDGQTIARRKQFQIPSDAAGMANAMTPIIQEMLSGKGGSEPRVAAAGVVSAPMPSLDDDAALADQIAQPDPRVAAAAAAAYAPPVAPVPAPLPPPVPVPAPAVPVATLDPSQITFKTSVADLSADQINAMIRFGPPAGGTPAPAPAPAPAYVPPPPPAPAPAPRANGSKIAEEEAELAALESNSMVDLDDGRRGGRNSQTSGPTRNGQTTSSVGGDLGHDLQFTARGGFSKYYGFNFFTGGAEAGIVATGGLHLVAGVEVYAVRRVLPPDIAAQELVYAEWNTIYPINAGFIYKVPIGIAQPYLGADAIFVQYYADDVGADWAGGARARAGVDLMFVRNFGLNVNVAAGGWYGQNWPLIQQGTGPGGFLPQVSGGTVIAF